MHIIGINADLCYNGPVMSVDEHTLQKIYKLISGELIPYSRSITTYPNEPDRTLHLACLELERRGLIYRHKDQSHADEHPYIVWKAINDET